MSLIDSSAAVPSLRCRLPSFCRRRERPHANYAKQTPRCGSDEKKKRTMLEGFRSANSLRPQLASIVNFCLRGAALYAAVERFFNLQNTECPVSGSAFNVPAVRRLARDNRQM